MNNIKISIITVSYNSQETIARTIESVVRQSYDNIEYCIVDGNSSDGTVDIIKKYYSLYPKTIKYVSEPDKGIYDAMNKGIRMATGGIIGIVNSDDWLEPSALESVNNAFVANGRNENYLYCGGMNFHNADGAYYSLMPNIEKFKSGATEFMMCGIRHPAVFVPMKVYQSIGAYDSRMAIMADTDFILRAYYNKVGLFGFQSVLSNMADGGASNSMTWKSGLQSFNDKRLMLSNFKIGKFKRYFVLSKTLCIIVAKRLFYKRTIKHS